MSRQILVCCFALFAACASTVLASAQALPSQTEASSASSSSPVAYVYVARRPVSNGSDQIEGYSAAPNGVLTSIPGSPFPESYNYLAVNGKWLFGVLWDPAATDNEEVIGSMEIGSNGALTQRQSVSVPQMGGALISIYLDHTGSTLYGDYYTTNNDFLSYNIDQATGQLTYVADLAGGPPDNSPVSFIENNQFAYSSSCYHYDPEIIGVQRASNGSLSYVNSNFPFPAEKSGGFYCPWRAAADPTDHLAIAMQPLNSNFGVDGTYQLATYTADSSGNLTTTSTYSNMPHVLVGTVNDYWMSPSGKYLAVGGSQGLQIFHFNGANPITKYTGLLTGNSVDPNVLGQLEPPVRHQQESGQAVCVYGDGDERDPSAGFAACDCESGQPHCAAEITSTEVKIPTLTSQKARR